MTRFICQMLWILLLGMAPVQAEILTSISSASIDDPKSFWSATMEEFYGRYDNGRKCWVAGGASEPLCMRPHLLSSVIENGGQTLYVAMAGYAMTPEGGRADCHACGGKLGLVVLRPRGDRLALVAKNSLSADVGSWGHVPSEDAFRVVPLGKNNHGWLMAFAYTGQGYTEGSVTVFGLLGDKIVDLGAIPTHSDNAGTCGDGLGTCYSHIYEVFTDPVPGPGLFGDLLVRKVESTSPNAPGSFRVKFSSDELKYVAPESLDAAMGQ